MGIVELVGLNGLAAIAAFGQYFTMIAMIVPAMFLALPERIVKMPAVVATPVIVVDEMEELAACPAPAMMADRAEWGNTHKSVLIGWEDRKARKELIQKAKIVGWYGIMIVKSSIEKAEARKAAIVADRAMFLKELEYANWIAKKQRYANPEKRSVAWFTAVHGW